MVPTVFPKYSDFAEVDLYTFNSSQECLFKLFAITFILLGSSSLPFTIYLHYLLLSFFTTFYCLSSFPFFSFVPSYCACSTSKLTLPKNKNLNFKCKCVCSFHKFSEFYHSHNYSVYTFCRILPQN